MSKEYIEAKKKEIAAEFEKGRKLIIETTATLERLKGAYALLEEQEKGLVNVKEEVVQGEVVSEEAGN